MNLFFATHLRRQYAHDVPSTPTNEDRLRAFRREAPVTLGNRLLTERLRARDYARHEAADGRERYYTGDHSQ